MILYIVFIIIGFFLLVKGADYLVDGSSDIAKSFNIPTIIIGLTIVAIGTSMPELMVSLTSSIEGFYDISIGNVVGSNIVNIFLILGICSIINPIKFTKEIENVENNIAIFATVILAVMGNNGDVKIITRNEGFFLIICCTAFIIYNIRKSSKEKSKMMFQTKGKKKSIIKSIIIILIGIASLKIGGEVVVKYSARIAKMIGISEKIISITIIAFSTSLPELITSINATLKGDVDMAIGNILGSEIFNIFLIVGISSIISPINYSQNYNSDITLLICGTIIFAIFPHIGKKHYMTRINGCIFITLYIFYLIYNVMK